MILFLHVSTVCVCLVTLYRYILEHNTNLNKFVVLFVTADSPKCGVVSPIVAHFCYCCIGESQSMGQSAAMEPPPQRTAVQQAAPPTEHEPEPEVNFPMPTVVSYSLDECLPSLEQSARVEPSPERFYTLPSCAEQDESSSPFSAASGQCWLFVTLMSDTLTVIIAVDVRNAKNICPVFPFATNFTAKFCHS